MPLPDRQFVSRGGTKLQYAIDNFKIDIKNRIILDVGSSTGGFVDCLLQSGAKCVYAVDTCYGELAWKLRNDPRVVLIERTNILHLQSLPLCHLERSDKTLVDLITIDSGWTKLEKVLPIVQKFLKPKGQIIALLKPHYEAPQHYLKKGILKEEFISEVKDSVVLKIKNLEFNILDIITSPIQGGGGNTEFLLLITVESQMHHPVSSK